MCCMSVCLNVYLCTTCVQCSGRPEEDSWSSRTEVKGRKLPVKGCKVLGIKSQFSGRPANALNH